MPLTKLFTLLSHSISTVIFVKEYILTQVFCYNVDGNYSTSVRFIYCDGSICKCYIC